MHSFAVWAPWAAQVELLIEDVCHPMVREHAGWWRIDVEAAGPGSRYGFVLDGGPVRPDPRSPFQPDGVDGLSAVVDHDVFVWSDTGWRGLALPGAVLYELHVGTFTSEGSFDAVVEELAYLRDLGVDAIELLPVAEFPGERGWGYDGVNLFAPYHVYGGPDGLKRLVDACHNRGLGVILDVVYNHLGPHGNYLPAFGPYFSDHHVTNWGAALNFDGSGSREVRRFVIDNALMWLADYHLDGLRLDAVHSIVDNSALHILEELAEEVAVLAAHVRRPLFLIAENDRNDPRLVRPRPAGGFGLNAAWADDWHHAMHAALTGDRGGYYQDFGSLTMVAKAMRQAWVYDGCWSAHRHRTHGRSPAGLTGDQFVVSLQNHDQVGNRARGERLSGLTSVDRLRVAAALLLTAPFVPMLFQGEEWGANTPWQYFTDHQDPSLGRAVRDGRRREFTAFGWNPEDVPDPQAAETYERSTLDWSEPAREPHGSVLDWYRELLALRRRIPALTDPRLKPPHLDATASEADQTIAVRRGPVRVLANLGGRAHTFGEHAWIPSRAHVLVLAASAPGVEAPTDTGTVVVPPDAVAIVDVSR
jgi:maltooligosyltrehalose trehalohydrolase